MIPWDEWKVEAPERAWRGALVWYSRKPPNGAMPYMNEYIRADIHEAEVACLLEALCVALDALDYCVERYSAAVLEDRDVILAALYGKSRTPDKGEV